VLAVASGGGHWVQLLRLRPTLEAHDVAFATVRPDYRVDVPDRRFYVVADATRWSRLALVRCAVGVLRVLLRERPDVVVSTGAAPGYFALRFGRWLGARTVWIDSIANVEQISRAGELAGRHADLWLTQWPHLARDGGPRWVGAVL
jgi:UDP-N-acetylglucosamine:LPS N-acetylglucosamine transferase